MSASGHTSTTRGRFLTADRLAGGRARRTPLRLLEFLRPFAASLKDDPAGADQRNGANNPTKFVFGLPPLRKAKALALVYISTLSNTLGPIEMVGPFSFAQLIWRNAGHASVLDDVGELGWANQA